MSCWRGRRTGCRLDTVAFECIAMTALIRMISGLVLWSMAFAVLYALQGLGCARGWTEPAVFGLTQTKAVLLAVWAGLIASQVVLLLWLMRRRDTQMERIGIAIGWIGLGATVITGLPILAISTCF